MSKIKENPIKFVQLFSIIYLVAYAILRVIYNIVVSSVYELQYFDIFEILGIIISLIPITLTDLCFNCDCNRSNASPILVI